MKTAVVSLIGDPIENLYLLGKKERESFLKLEARVSRLISSNFILRFGQDIVSRAKALMKKKESSFFDECIAAYAEGLGVDTHRYKSFISLFELAAHYGQVYPELKGILPGCTSLFENQEGEFTHSRLFDFPLMGIFEETPRLYQWQLTDKPSIITYSCEGLAPLFFQGIHSCGFSFALHHKPANSFHKDGQNIFQIAFESLFSSANAQDFKKEIKKKCSLTKWGFLTLNQNGLVVVMDIDGPATHVETFDLKETAPLIFTNVPLHRELYGNESFIQFSQNRQNWLKEKINKDKKQHPLDTLTDVGDQKIKNWLHPVATLSTVGAIHFNLSKGMIDVKEGEYALVASDTIVRFAIDGKTEAKTIKSSKEKTAFEKSWKRISMAQAEYDQGNWDLAYHELQMALATMPHQIWKEILSFYLLLWEFKFVSNSRELSQIYKKVLKLSPPPVLKDQWLFLCMRLEKKLGLVLTINPDDLSPYCKNEFIKETEASKPLFTTWMKLLYPRIEVLDVFSPHHK